MTPSGKRDRRITILRASHARNAMNEKVAVWTPLGVPRWAAFTPVSDGERFRAGETLAQQKARFTILYCAEMASVDPRDRVQFDGHVWDINGVKEVGRRQELEITATARAEAP